MQPDLSGSQHVAQADLLAESVIDAAVQLPQEQVSAAAEQEEVPEASVSLGDLAEPEFQSDDKVPHDAHTSGRVPFSPRAINSWPLQAEQLCLSPVSGYAQLASPDGNAELQAQDSLTLSDNMDLQLDDVDGNLAALGIPQDMQQSGSMLESSSQSCMALQALTHQPRYALSRECISHPGSQPEGDAAGDDVQLEQLHDSEPCLSPEQPHPWAMLTSNSAHMHRAGSGSVAPGLRRSSSQAHAASMGSKRGDPIAHVPSRPVAAASKAVSAACDSCSAGSQPTDTEEALPGQKSAAAHAELHRPGRTHSSAGTPTGRTPS